jgi:hypothetical protein
MSKKLYPILAAAFGGISPNLLSLGIMLTGKQPEMPELTYILGLLIFAFMGAMMAIIWKEKDLKKAFYLGIGLPALIQTSISNISEEYLHKPKYSSFAFFSQEALAQEPVAVEVRQDRKVKVISADNKVGTVTIIFLSSDEKHQEKQPIRYGNTINVPSYASWIKIMYKDSISAKQSLLPRSETGTTTLKVKVKKNPWSGFLKALGFKGISSYSIELEREPKE